MCSQKQTSYNEMRLDIFLVAHTKLRYRLIIQPTVQPQTPVGGAQALHKRARMNLIVVFNSLIVFILETEGGARAP